MRRDQSRRDAVQAVASFWRAPLVSPVAYVGYSAVAAYRRTALLLPVPAVGQLLDLYA